MDSRALPNRIDVTPQTCEQDREIAGQDIRSGPLERFRAAKVIVQQELGSAPWVTLVAPQSIAPAS